MGKGEILQGRGIMQRCSKLNPETPPLTNEEEELEGEAFFAYSLQKKAFTLSSAEPVGYMAIVCRNGPHSNTGGAPSVVRNPSSAGVAR